MNTTIFSGRGNMKVLYKCTILTSSLMKYRIRIHEKYSWRLRYAVSMPFILLPLFPTIVLDLVVEIYQHICFPLYRVPLVDRENYIIFDRSKLPYLNWYERLNCLYCSYVNGVLAYAGKVAGDTESYWCGIKHKSFTGYVEPEHHKDFVPYGDKEAFIQKYGEL